MFQALLTHLQGVSFRGDALLLKIGAGKRK
jgi:hypothetical protein